MKEGMWCHVEIPSKDPARAKSFYGEVLGWTFEDVPIPGRTYTIYRTREGGIGGGIWDSPPDMPRQTINYVQVDDMDSVLERIEKNGGKIIRPKQKLAEAGWRAVVSDPDGNIFGLWKSAGAGA